MKKHQKSEFHDWLEYHEYHNAIVDFLDWVSDNSILPYTGFLKKTGFDYLKTALMDLDVISEFLIDKKILKNSLFKPSQFFNADKLMRASKKAGLISHVLKDRPIDEHSDSEEWMWYTMRLYSNFLDFYELSDEESESFNDKISSTNIPAKVKTGQTITITIASILFIGIIAASFYFSVIFSKSKMVSIGVGVFGVVALAFWITQGIFGSFISQFKKAKQSSPLVCLHAQITAKQKMKPYSGSSLETVSINATPIHDSLGLSFLLHSLKDYDLDLNKTTYEIIYLKTINLVIDIRPIITED